MKTSNQLDGSNDECDSSKMNSLRSKERKKPKRFQISFQVDGTGPNVSFTLNDLELSDRSFNVLDDRR